MLDKAERRVAAHRIATQRRAAGRPQWDLTLNLGPLDRTRPPHELAELIHKQIKQSSWPTKALEAVKKDWLEDGATAEPGFEDDTELGQMLEELEHISKDKDIEHEDVDFMLEQLCNEADLSSLRVWIQIS